MALNGKFILNDAEYSPLIFPGVGNFMAFSGEGVYRNRGGCGNMAKSGPLPPGRYWIVARGGGGFFSKELAWVKDMYNKYHNGAVFKHSEWFALYPDGWGINDYMWIEGVKREHFRLHPGTRSEGCITMKHNSDFAMLRNVLLRTPLIRIPCMKNLMAFGAVEVIANDKTCP